MSSSPGFDFSFAVLKTAVLYHLKKNTRENQEDIATSGAFHHLSAGESHPLSLAPEPSLSL